MNPRPEIRFPKTWSPSYNLLIERAYYERNPDLLRGGRRREVWILMSVVFYNHANWSVEKAYKNREIELILGLLEYLEMVQKTGIPAGENADPFRKKFLEIGAKKMIEDGWIPKLQTVLGKEGLM
jgi:hypothetical protein